MTWTAVLILVCSTAAVCVRLVNDARWRIAVSHCALVLAVRRLLRNVPAYLCSLLRVVDDCFCVGREEFGFSPRTSGHHCMDLF